MASVRRYDAGSAGRAVRLDNGWLRAPAYLTRTGVFEYRLPDGSIRRELRPPEEVFKADSLETFALVPLTDEHPDPAQAPDGLTAQNTRAFQVGHIGEVIRRDGDKVAATLIVTDGKVAEKVIAGKCELSCGYFADSEETPGVFEGQPYDAIQRNIRGNHVALVARGRAGPEVRVRLDSADAVQVNQPAAGAAEESSPMEKYTIDGVEFEVSKPAAQAFAKTEKAHAAEVAKLKADALEQGKKLETETARADAAERKIVETEKLRADAADPKKFEAAVAKRVELLGKAREVLGSEFKSDGLDERALRLAVIAKLDPEFKADGKSDEHVAATFDAAIKYAGKAAPAVVRVDGAADPAAETDRRAAFQATVENLCEKGIPAAK